MPQRITLYFVPGHFSISVENGVTRETRGKTVTEMVAAMHPSDIDVLANLVDELDNALKDRGASEIKAVARRS